MSSFGDTEDEAHKGFDEALSIFLKETQERHSLEKILLDLGWNLQKLPTAKYTPPDARALQDLITAQYPSISSSKKINERVEIPVH